MNTHIGTHRFLIEQEHGTHLKLHEPPFCHNFSPLLDTRAGVPAEERFKALAGTVKSSLFAFVSGETTDKSMIDFRAAQANIATCPELKGRVGYVRTAPYRATAT